MTDITGFIITFRETIEAMLILAAIVAYLSATKQGKMFKYVYLGAVTGILLSIVFAFGFIILIGGFEGTAEELFEGILLISGAVLISLLIIWLTKTMHGVKGIQKNVLSKLNTMEAGSVFLISLIVVLREGVEIVLFLGALSFQDSTLAIGSAIGILIGAILGYLIYKKLIKINLMKMFALISVLLVFFGAGMLAQGAHEFQEAKILPFFEEKIYDIGGEQLADGSYQIMHEKGAIGAILRGIFGYDSNPTQLQGIVYLLYLVVMGAVLMPRK